MDTTDAVTDLQALVADAARARPAVALIERVLTATDSPGIDGLCADRPLDSPGAVAAALLDAGPTLMGVASSPRTALALYDAHESWSGGVDDIEADQARDLVARVGALAAWAVQLETDPWRGLERLLDDPVGRALLTLFAAIEVVLSRGTAFEPVERGVLSGDVAAQDALIEQVLQDIQAAGAKADGARDILGDLVDALEGLVESLGDHIEDIAEAVRSTLPELAGGREEWAEEARSLRIYGLVAARMVLGPAAHEATAAPEPTVDRAPLEQRRATATTQHASIQVALTAARARRRSLQDERDNLLRHGPSDPLPPPPAAALSPHWNEAVERTARALAESTAQHLRAEQARASLSPPGPRSPQQSAESSDALRAAVQHHQHEVRQLRTRIAAAQAAAQATAQATAQAAAVRLSELKSRHDAGRTRRAAVESQLRELRKTRSSHRVERTRLTERRAHRPAAPRPAEVLTSPAISVRERAILRGKTLRCRARVVSARAELAEKERTHTPSAPPPAPSPAHRPDPRSIGERIAQLEGTIERLQRRRAEMLDAAEARLAALKDQMRALQARRRSAGEARHRARGVRQRIVAERNTARDAREQAAARPLPTAQPIPDALTTERRERLEDLIIEAGHRLHRARWAHDRALACHQNDRPEVPDAPEHHHIFRRLERARTRHEGAEAAVSEVRTRIGGVRAARESILQQVQQRGAQIRQQLQRVRTRRQKGDEAREKLGQRVADVRARIGQLVPPDDTPPPSLLHAQAAVQQARSAVEAAEANLHAAVGRGASLPLPPEPVVGRKTVDIAPLRAVLAEAEAAHRAAQERKEALLAAIEAQRLPLLEARTALQERAARIRGELGASRTRQQTDQQRHGEVVARSAALRQALSTPAPPLHDHSAAAQSRFEETCTAQGNAAELEALCTAVLHEHQQTIPAAPAARPDLRDQLQMARLAHELATAAVAEVEARLQRSSSLEDRLQKTQQSRQKLQPALEHARGARTAPSEAHSALRTRMDSVRARMDALAPANAEDDPSLPLLRELATAAASTLEAARTRLDTVAPLPDPPTHPPDPRPAATKRREAAAAAVAEREAAARAVEQQRDAAYIALRQEHLNALQAARPTRRLLATQRRRDALQRAKATRKARREELVGPAQEVAPVPDALRTAVEKCRADIAQARERLGERVAAVAEARSKAARDRAQHSAHEEQLEKIDESLARWTRRVRRAEQSVAGLRKKIAAAQQDTDAGETAIDTPAAPPPALAPPPAPLGPPPALLAPPPAPGMPAVPAPPPTAFPSAPGREDTLLDAADHSAEAPSMVALPAPLGGPPPPPPGVPTRAVVPPPPGIRPAASADGPSNAPAPPPTIPVPRTPERAVDPPSIEPPAIPSAMGADPSDGTPPPVPSSVQSLLARIAAKRQSRPGSTPASDNRSSPPPLVPGTRTQSASGPPSLPPIGSSPPAHTTREVVAIPERVRSPAPPQAGMDIDLPSPTTAPGSSTGRLPAPPPLGIIGPSRAASDRPSSLPPDPGLPPLPAARGPVDPHTDPADIDAILPPSPASQDADAAVLANQSMHNAATVILSREALLAGAMADDDDDDDDEGWGSSDAEKTMLLSREEQLRRRDALLAEGGTDSGRRREQWSPPKRKK